MTEARESAAMQVTWACKGESERLWTRDFILLIVIAALASTAITTQMGTLPLYVESLGGSTTESGAIVGILGISALIFRFPTGVMIDKYGRRIMLLIGLGILVVDFTLLNVFRTLMILFCLRFLQGIGNGMQTTATSTIAADLIPARRLQVGLGYFSLAQVVPSAIGPMIGLAVVERFGYDALFVVGMVLTAISLLLSLFLKVSPVAGGSGVRRGRANAAETAEAADVAGVSEKAGADAGAAQGDGGSLALLLRPSVVVPSAIMFVVFCAAAGVTAFIAQYAGELHIANVGTYFVVASLSTVVVRLVISPQLIRFPQPVIIAVSLVMVIVPFFLIAHANNLAVLLLAALLYGAGQANLQPMMNTLVLQGIEPGQRGRVTAFFSASGDVAYGGGAMLWGYVASLCGFRMMFMICGACAACGIVLYAWFMRMSARSAARR